MNPSGESKGPRGLRILKWMGLTLGGVMLLILLVIGGGVIYLSTAGGTRWAVNTAIEQANQAIPGEITLGRAEVDWTDRIELFDVALLTPEGERVIYAERLLLGYELPPLLSRILSLEELEIDGPEIALITYADGSTNLDRAIDSGDTTPTPTPTPTNSNSGPAFEVQAPEIHINDGVFIQVDTTADAPRQVALTGLKLDAAYALSEGNHSVKLTPLTLNLQEPPIGPATLEADLGLILDDSGSIEVRTLTLGAEGLALQGEGAIRNFNTPTGSLTLKADPVDTALLEAFAPDLPLKGVVAMGLTLEGEEGVLNLDGALTLPEGLLTLLGELDLSRLSEDSADLGYDITLIGEEIEPSALYTDSLPALAPLNFELRVDGRGIDPDALEATINLDAAQGEVEGYVYEDISLRGAMAAGSIEINTLDILTPYGEAGAKGEVDLDGPLDLTATVEVPNLGPIGETFGQTLQGQASVQAKVTGTLESPKATFGAQVQDVAVLQSGAESLTPRGLELDGSMVLVDGGPKVEATGAGESLESEAFTLSQFDLGATYQGDTASLQMNGLDPEGSPLKLSADAVLKDTTRITTKALEIPVGDNKWTLDAPFEVAIFDERVTIEPFAIKATRENGLITAGGVFSQAGHNDLTLEAKAVSLGPLAPLMGESLTGLRGEVGLKARIKGPASAPNIRATVSLEGLAAETIPTVGGEIALKTRGPGSGTGLTFDLSFAEGGTLKGTVTAPVEATLETTPTFDPKGALGGDLTLEGYDLKALRPLLASEEDGTEPELAGILGGTLSLGGHPSKPNVTLSSTIEGLRYSGERMTARVDLSLVEEALTLEGALANPAMDNARFLTMALDVPFHLGEDLSPQTKWEDPINGEILLRAPDARVLAPLDPELAKLRGILDLDLKVKGRIGSPAFLMTARGRRLKYGGTPETQVDFDLAFAEGQGATIGRLKMGDQPVSAMDGRIKMNLGEFLRGDELVMRDLRLSIDVPSFELTSLPREWRGNRLEGGNLRASALLLSEGAIPSFEMDIAGSDIRVTGAQNQDIALQGGYHNQRLVLRARALDDGRPSLTLDGDLPMAITLPLDGEDTFDYTLGDTLDLTATLKGLNLTLVNAFLPMDGWVEGALDGDLEVKGTPSTPDLTGTIALEGGKAFFPTYGIYFSPISMASTMDPEGITLRRLSIEAQEGSMEAEGRIALFDEDTQSLEFTTAFDGFQIINGPLGRLTLDGDLALGGSLDAPDLKGDIVIPEGIIKLPDIRKSAIEYAVGIESSKSLAETELPGGIWVLTEDDYLTWEAWLEGEEEEESAPTNVKADVSLSIPKNLWLRNDSGEILTEVKGDVRMRLLEGHPILTGSIETIRGELRLFAEPLVIQEGEVTFTGGKEIDPRIDLLAAAETNDYGEVSLKVNGPVSDPELQFLSDEGYEPGDVISILIVGRPLSQGAQGGDEAQVTSQLESIAAGILSGWAQRHLADKTPLDYIEISADGFSSADLRVGKYLTDNLFLSYQRKLDTSGAEEENINEVRAEYQVTRDLYFESFYGDANIWGAELFWRNQY